MCMSDLPVCTYVDPTHAGALQGQKRVLGPLEMEVKMGVSHYVGHKLHNLWCRSLGREMLKGQWANEEKGGEGGWIKRDPFHGN